MGEAPPFLAGAFLTSAFFADAFFAATDAPEG